MDISEMDISEMMTSEVSEIRYIYFRYPDFPIYHPFYPTPNSNPIRNVGGGGDYQIVHNYKNNINVMNH